MIKIFIPVVLCGIMLTSCADNTEDEQETVNKDSAEEAYQQMEMLQPDSTTDFVEDTNVHTITPDDIYGE